MRAKTSRNPNFTFASRIVRRKQALAMSRLLLVLAQLQLLLLSLPRLSPLLQLQLFSLLQRRLQRPLNSCQPTLPRRDGFYDNTRLILKVALCAKVSDRTARADSIRIPYPS